MAALKIESGVQLLARLTKKPSLECFYPQLLQAGPIPGDLIEISSDTCTSHIMTDIVCEALTHTKTNESPAEILIVDTDGNMNYDELIDKIRRKILASKNYLCMDAIEMNKELEKLLSRLHITNIYDATQYYTTIYNLENILVEHPGISMIIFNTLTAFYWSEQGFKITRMDLYTKSLINTIQNVTKDHKTICLYTRPDYFCTNKETENGQNQLSYQIQLLNNDKDNYQVNIKTSDKKITHFYNVSDGNIRWVM